jgi:hypothetical protein
MRFCTRQGPREATCGYRKLVRRDDLRFREGVSGAVRTLRGSTRGPFLASDPARDRPVGAAWTPGSFPGLSRFSCYDINSPSWNARSPDRASNPRTERSSPRSLACSAATAGQSFSSEGTRSSVGIDASSRTTGPIPIGPAGHSPRWRPVGRSSVSLQRTRRGDTAASTANSPDSASPCRIDRVGDPQASGHRPCTRPIVSVLDDIPACASGRRPRL